MEPARRPSKERRQTRRQSLYCGSEGPAVGGAGDPAVASDGDMAGDGPCAPAAVAVAT